MKSIELIARRVNSDEVRFSSEDHALSFVLPLGEGESAKFKQGDTYRVSFTHSTDESKTDKQTSKAKK